MLASYKKRNTTQEDVDYRKKVNCAIDIAMHMALVALLFASIILYKEKDTHTWYIILIFVVCPLVFTLTDAIILIAAVVRIWANYKDDPQVIANQKSIFMHIMMLFIFFLIEAVTLTSKYIYEKKH